MAFQLKSATKLLDFKPFQGYSQLLAKLLSLLISISDCWMLRWCRRRSRHVLSRQRSAGFKPFSPSQAPKTRSYPAPGLQTPSFKGISGGAPRTEIDGLNRAASNDPRAPPRSPGAAPSPSPPPSRTCPRTPCCPPCAWGRRGGQGPPHDLNR